MQVFAQLEEKDGELVIVHSRVANNDPVLLTFRYPTGVSARDWQEFVGRTLVYVANGVWRMVSAPHATITEKGVGVLTESPIPKPVTRMQTRWNWLESRWEKLTRRGCWVAAE